MREIKPGVELIAEERKEQIEKHGRDVQSDVESNGAYQLATAANRISFNPDDEGFDLMREPLFIPDGWNSVIWNKMLDKSYKDRLIIAGALIAAEIDRLNALTPTNGK